MNIKDLANIFSGYAFRSSVEENSQGDTFLIQAKDINKCPVYLNESELTRISKPSNELNYIQNGDVLLIARGLKAGNFKASVFKSENKKTIASSSVLIIRINDTSKLLPDFLCIYINSQLGQVSLVQAVTGSYIGSITKNNLIKTLNVPMYTIEKQKQVVQVHKNILEQLKMDKRRMEIKENIINKLITN